MKRPKRKPTTKSFAGLRESLYAEFDNLRNDRITPTKANSIARMASEITRSALAELNALRLFNKMADDSQRAKLKTITNGKIPE